MLRPSPAAVNLSYAFRNGFPVFFWDHWVWLGNYFGRGWPQALWTPLNEHRVIVPGVFYALDLAAFGGSFVLLKAILLSAHVGCAYLLIRPVYMAQYVSRTLAYFYSGLVLVWSSWFIQGNNMFWPFQICIILCDLFALVAATALAGSFSEARLHRLATALTSAALATFCFGHGVLLWPVLLALAIGARLKRTRLAALLGAAMICLVLYFSDYALPQSLAGASTLSSNPIRILSFLALFVGTPIFLPGTSNSSVVTNVLLHGVVTLGIAISLLLIFRYFRSLDQSRDRARSVFLAVILLTLAAAGVAAVARGASSPLTALADRYATFAIRFWISVIALVTLEISQRSVKRPWLTPVWCSCLVLAGLYTVPSHLTWARLKSEETRRKELAIQSLISGEPDRRLVERELYPSLEHLEIVDRLLLVKGLGHYRGLRQRGLNQPLTSVERDNARRGCAGLSNSAPPLSVKIGLFKDGIWLLDHNNNVLWDGPSIDLLFRLGQAGDKSTVGDWNGDGKDEIGVFRSGMWLLDHNGNGKWDGPSLDRLHWLGQEGDAAVAGDWNGDRKTEIGVFRNGMWLLDHNGNGKWDGPSVDRLYWLGQTGDTALVGDWNGDGKNKIGISRSGMWLLDHNGNGKWDGPSLDRLHWLGQARDTPVAAKWNGDVRTHIGLFRNGVWQLDYNGNGRWDGPAIDRLYCLGQAGEVPVTGRW